MNPNISEFSYGYALTESLINSSSLPIIAAPMFPSLIEEGTLGGGYDLQLPFEGFPLFLQFKLSHKMVRDTVVEAQIGRLTPPFFRMHLRPTKHSQQHPMLLALESTGVAVYYAAPYFHNPSELNQAYLNEEVVARSIFIRPSEIGPLPNDDAHHVSFKNGCPTYLFSQEPRCIREKANERQDFIDELQVGYIHYEHMQRTDQSIRIWTEKLITIIKAHRPHIHSITDESLYTLQNRLGGLNTLVYLARTFFECNVVIVTSKKE